MATLTITRTDNGNTITGPEEIIADLALFMDCEGVDFTLSYTNS
jgi:hypothetical protein